MKKPTIYGIKNCDTMKKAFKWLEQQGIGYRFHDYKKESVKAADLAFWLEQVPWEELINRRGTTWRKLSDDSKANIDNEKAIKLMLANTSLIKRPVLVINDIVQLGFKPQQYEQTFDCQSD